MRIKMGIGTFALLAIVAGCSTAVPESEVVDPVVPTPLEAVDRAQSVADQVEQRQADLEAQINAGLGDPFARP